MIVTAALLLVPLALAFVILYFLFRHWPLVALIILAPVPGYAAVLGLSIFDWIQIPSPFLVIVGIVAAGFVADEFVLVRSSGGDNALAMRTASNQIALPLLAVVVVWMLLNAARLGTSASIPSIFSGAIGLLAVFLSIALMMQLARFFPFGEEFISKTNRFREKGERLVDWLLRLNKARWALSLSGIFLVFAALIVFDQRAEVFQRIAARGGAAAWPSAFLLASCGLYFVVHDWRLALATCAALLMMSLSSLPDILISQSALLFIVYVAFLFAPYLRSGDDMVLAVSRAFSRSGLGIGTLAVLVIVALAGGAVGYYLTAGVYLSQGLVMAVVEAAIALVFLPAFAVAIETLFPRRETLEARYRVH